ncbi:aldehyde dehydrogenase family protein [Halobacillus shinanisalinarum]|uniref:Aldehyde dehydrogenase family protein n=1 Tax=Halobacillus shinanisalinarum TaxID=2932258 RepID=A0ABY4GWT9_9BACI|nr:aldehyde dehydrogenase family protein [Halobacillus shinanisalinarum]UOQ91862.1 aldehyde dehydrogenase family protein [Halobacillus shinanisalinarum]
MSHSNYINGQWQEPISGDYKNNVSPHDSQEIEEFPVSTEADVQKAISSANKAFPSWKKLSYQQRGTYLLKAAEILEENTEEIGRDLTLEEGKTLTEGIGETRRAINILKYYAGEAMQPIGSVIPSANSETTVYTKRTPLGPVGLITPWNFPIAIPAWKMAPALIYGNTVVIKPADLTPKCVYHLMNAFHEAGLPAGVVNCVFGRGSVVGNELVENRGIKGISFTGSNSVGRAIQSKAMANGKKVQLEMGGKNPLVILADAGIDNAVELAIKGAYQSTGQKCTATSRVIVEEEIYESFRDRLIERTQSLKVGNPLVDDSFMGPCVSQSQYETVLRMIDQGKNEGNLLCGGESIKTSELENGYYIQPTIFELSSQNARIATEEIFGPVIALLKAADYQEAVQMANDTEFGLSASICTNNLSRAQQFIDQIEVGMVHVNSETAGAEPQIPFGGMKNSSDGPREQGKTAIDFYTQVKTVYYDQHR